MALCLGQFLAHQTGLSFSVLIPILTSEWGLSASQAGVILGGFQLGNLASYVAVGFLLDRMRGKPIMAWSAALVGAGDLLFALGARDFASGLALRLLVGVLVGGLYLPALKHIADTVPPDRRGVATGFYVASIVMAYAAPLYYVGAMAPRVGWQATMAGIGVLELLGALVMAWKVPSIALPQMVGPADVSRYLGDVLRNPSARRVIVAYTGHNWELFGMWGWIAPFMVASLTARGAAGSDALAWGGLLAATSVGLAGSIGAIAGGRLSDRLGRARAAMLILSVSLVCSAVFGRLFAAPLILMVGVSLLYGIVALADSPSYAAALMEVVPARSLGGAFSLQMLSGWTATAVAPAALGLVLDLASAAGASPAAQWGWAFGLLALGPVVGVVALRPLQARARANDGRLPVPVGGDARRESNGG
ncbi:MAG: MFS transporter [Armatimonadetes bacterium]|nr:MFS transporter [Armatimonadota bacterium]